MRYWYDFEFLEDGRTIDPISVGVVAEDGREYYAVWDNINDEPLYSRICEHRWLVKNVVPHLPLVPQPDGELVHLEGAQRKVLGATVPYYYEKTRWALDMDSTVVKPRRLIRAELRGFFLADEEPELWAWYAAYDHVALAQLWRPMADLPANLPMYTNDLRQTVRQVGIREQDLPTLPPGAAHHPLSDAHNLRDRFYYVAEYCDGRQL